MRIFIALLLFTTFSHAQNSERRKTSEVPQSFLDAEPYFIRNQPNSFSAVAHGYTDTYLECKEAKIEPGEWNSLSYKITPGDVEFCTIGLFGIGTNGKKVQLGVYKIPVVDKPVLDVYLDKFRSGTKVSGSISNVSYKQIFCAICPENAVKTWRLEIGEHSYNGNNDKLSAEAKKAIENLPTGQVIKVVLEVLNKAEERITVTGVFLK